MSIHEWLSWPNHRVNAIEFHLCQLLDESLVFFQAPSGRAHCVFIYERQQRMRRLGSITELNFGQWLPRRRFAVG